MTNPIDHSRLARLPICLIQDRAAEFRRSLIDQRFAQTLKRLPIDSQSLFSSQGTHIITETSAWPPERFSDGGRDGRLAASYLANKSKHQRFHNGLTKGATSSGRAD